MAILRKPWWLRAVTSPNMSVTIAPNIYLSDKAYDDPYERAMTVAHEEVHIRQQTDMGLTKWMLRYFTDGAFRLDQEAEAYATGLLMLPPEKFVMELAWVCQELAGPSYHGAAKSLLEAQTAVLNWVNKFRRAANGH